MAGRIHFSFFILLTLLDMAIPLAFNKEFKMDIKDSLAKYRRDKNLYTGSREDRISFAKKYFEEMIGKKIIVPNFNYYSGNEDEIFFIYNGFGSLYWDNTIMSNIEQPKIRQLNQFNSGDEIIIKGYKIKKYDDYSLYAKSVLVQIQYNNQILNLPVELFEKELLNPIKNNITIFKQNFPKEETVCENIMEKGNRVIDPKLIYPSNKNEIFKGIKERYDYAKSNNPYLKNIGELYLNQKNEYCFDMHPKSEEEFFSLRLNQNFIFKPMYK